VAEASLETTLSRALKNLPSGRSYAPVHSLVSRIIEDLKLMETLTSRAECVSKSMGSCFGNVCKTGCANIYYSREDGEVVIWKVGSNAFSLRKTSRGFRASVKDFEIALEGRKVRASLPSSEGRELVEGDINEPSSLLRSYSILSYVLNKVEPMIRNALENLTRCARERRLSC